MRRASWTIVLLSAGAALLAALVALTLYAARQQVQLNTRPIAAAEMTRVFIDASHQARHNAVDFSRDHRHEGSGVEFVGDLEVSRWRRPE